jgi:peptide chain release factor 1
VLNKLATIEMRFQEIEDELIQPDLDGRACAKLNRERSEIEPIVIAYRQYKDTAKECDEAKLLLKVNDAEMRNLAREEIDKCTKNIEEIKKHLTLLLLPKDLRDKKNVILEIRAGTGGEEAGIFCGDLLRMYTRFAERLRWKIEVLSSSESAKGGFKEIILLIEGNSVFSKLKFESGTHRVQRIPLTESQGRVHTSACTIAVLPEAEDVEVNINPADLRIDTYRSSGSGGQHVNTTDSAVRITHMPTGIVSECQDERSQHKNKDKAMKMLRSRIYEQLRLQKEQEMSQDRKTQVGSGDRSERIRTYNYPQGRVTDHRISMTLYRLNEFMDGDITEIIEALGANHTAELLKQQK